MKTGPILFFGVAASIAGVLLYGQAQHAGVELGDRAPEFTVQGQEGGNTQLSKLGGGLVFLNVWATWCGACVDEMPDMELIYRAFKGRKFRMIAISADKDRGGVKRFYEQHGLTFPFYIDPERRISEKYGVFAFPETFIIDASGHVLKHYIGSRRWATPEEMSSIEAMIQRQEASLETHAD